MKEKITVALYGLKVDLLPRSLAKIEAEVLSRLTILAQCAVNGV